jgi:thioredoxin reductase (NADPH)
VQAPAAAVFVLIGATPHSEWLPDVIARDSRGFVLTGADAAADDASSPEQGGPFLFETSVPGIFAVGDIRHGSVKRVASSVREGSIVVRQIHERIALDERSRNAAPAAAGGG